jgi:hypothetical protein
MVVAWREATSQLHDLLKGVERERLGGEEQDVERLAPDRLDGEEVGREDPRRL